MASKPDGEPFLLLHIDDSADDRLLVRESILLTNTPFSLRQARSLEEARSYFESTNDAVDPKGTPPLILLDLNMGQQSGIEFLNWLRIEKKRADVPVVVFSASADPRDIEDCYVNGADHFMSKVSDLTRLKVIIRSLHLSFAVLKRPGPLVLLPEYRADPRRETELPQSRPGLHRSS